VQLVLVRHAEPAESARGRCYGRLDFELSAWGRTQSEQLARQLSAEPVAAVVSSPRRRAIDTARPIAELHGLAVGVVESLRELDFGEIEGRTYDEIAAARPELFAQWMRAPTAVRFPGGESFDSLRRRVADAVCRLRETYDGRLVVAVTHGGVVRAVLVDALGVPVEHTFRLAVDPASLTRIEWVHDVPIVRSLNVVPRQVLVRTAAI
jgi:broad specificity phosphatase PhoE